MKDKISCPTCNKEKTWREDNPFRPFCSERCKLIDLGEWADEQHRIPGEPAHPFDIENPTDNSSNNNQDES